MIDEAWPFVESLFENATVVVVRHVFLRFRCSRPGLFGDQSRDFPLGFGGSLRSGAPRTRSGPRQHVRPPAMGSPPTCRRGAPNVFAGTPWRGIPSWGAPYPPEAILIFQGRSAPVLESRAGQRLGRFRLTASRILKRALKHSFTEPPFFKRILIKVEKFYIYDHILRHYSTVERVFQLINFLCSFGEASFSFVGTTQHGFTETFFYDYWLKGSISGGPRVGRTHRLPQPLGDAGSGSCPTGRAHDLYHMN